MNKSAVLKYRVHPGLNYGPLYQQSNAVHGAISPRKC